MGQRIIKTLEDDLDGSEADETVDFSLDGVAYQIDLNDGNAARLREALADYVAAARRTGGRKTRGGTAKQGAALSRADQREQLREIREWARDQGIDVSDRGRIAGWVVEKFEARKGKVRAR